MVVDLAPGDHRHELVEQADERAHDPALGLPSLAEHDHVVPGDDRVGQLRQHGVVVADDARKQRLSSPQAGEEVAAHLLFDCLSLVPARA